MENQTENPNSAQIDWLWVLWSAVYAVAFVVASMCFAIADPAAVFFLGVIALAALKYLIRFSG